MFRSTRTFQNSHSPYMPTDRLSEAGHRIVHDFHDLRDDAHTLHADVRDAAHTAADAARYTGTQMRHAARNDYRHTRHFHP